MPRKKKQTTEVNTIENITENKEPVVEKKTQKKEKVEWIKVTSKNRNKLIK